MEKLGSLRDVALPTVIIWHDCAYFRITMRMGNVEKVSTPPVSKPEVMRCILFSYAMGRGVKDGFFEA